MYYKVKKTMIIKTKNQEKGLFFTFLGVCNSLIISFN